MHRYCYFVVIFAGLQPGDNFNRFDFGTEGNLERYGTPEPAEYDLSLVRAPVVIIYGDNDPLTPSQVLIIFYFQNRIQINLRFVVISSPVKTLIQKMYEITGYFMSSKINKINNNNNNIK